MGQMELAGGFCAHPFSRKRVTAVAIINGEEIWTSAGVKLSMGLTGRLRQRIFTIVITTSEGAAEVYMIDVV